ncbi:HAD-like protein [Pseudovirgaria hyperparasitica]|uniref:HAD-like protein n=1 Tax=Pseudovirgaria hyperparasitica TaxID=470096 RepID=A0A6A6W605_9PEZI|nr:HAD-like protein [Pseudovirgaria hyperparasitica]KAF2758312.1 HAD-like protein [Pseudovirgaria hyperparasitica]
MTDQARIFRPLRDDSDKKDGVVLRGIIFDVDGTLCLPQNYMFGQMRAALKIDKSVDILEHIFSLPQPEQDAAQDAIKSIEREAMALQQPQEGVVELMEYLQAKGLRKGICTRNFNAPVDHLLSKFLPGHTMDLIITRSFYPPKPDPAGILHIANVWAETDGWSMPTASQRDPILTPVVPRTPTLTHHPRQSQTSTVTSAVPTPKSVQQGERLDVIMVGDSIDDMTAGYRAGAATVLLINRENEHLADHEHTDVVVKKLSDLIEILEAGFRGKTKRSGQV